LIKNNLKHSNRSAYDFDFVHLRATLFNECGNPSGTGCLFDYRSISETGGEDDCHERDWDDSPDVVCQDNAPIHNGNLMLSRVA
jgi:hypothetical protein